MKKIEYYIFEREKDPRNRKRGGRALNERNKNLANEKKEWEEKRKYRIPTEEKDTKKGGNDEEQRKSDKEDYKATRMGRDKRKCRILVDEKTMKIRTKTNNGRVKGKTTK